MVSKIKKNKIFFIIMALSIIFMVGCTTTEEPDVNNLKNEYPIPIELGENPKVTIDKSGKTIITNQGSEQEKSEEVNQEEKVIIEETEDIFEGHKIIEVDGGNTSGVREPNVAVNIGYGDRVYWAFTNEYGQLVRVIAKEIILQDDTTEPVTSDGRYYSKMADVPGVGAVTGYDRGHIIADSLGGVANAYNITPQNATLNRHGDQAYMEKAIRDAGGCTDFEAIITYPDTETQIPSNYKYTYTLKGNVIVDEFPNVNPDEYNKDKGIIEVEKELVTTEFELVPEESFSEDVELKKVDTNGNGKVTIAEAKAAGYKMPITRDHWLYKYMTDADGDGQVGE